VCGTNTSLKIFYGLCSKGDQFCHILKIVQAVQNVVDVNNGIFIRSRERDQACRKFRNRRGKASKLKPETRTLG